MKRDDDAYYEAMKARDTRFDGKFFVGVKTTGIYCRPICPAKPKRENVEFFSNLHEAERAGYRPCLRCRPESAPRSPVWIGKTAVVKRALKMLHQQNAIDLDEDAFAEKFGVSARHLRRLFIEEIGKTPKQLCFENRLNISRTLLTETALPVSEIAFASGFQSVRRFNEAFQTRFKKSPSVMRRKPSTRSDRLKIKLPYRPPFDFEGLLHFYRSHQVGDLEWFETGKMHRLVEHEGELGEITISDEPKNSNLILEINFKNTAAIYSIISKVRSLFDLDSDPILIANALAIDPKMKNLLKKHPGVRTPSGWDPFEVAISGILGQLVSVSRGKQLMCDLIEKLGSDSGKVCNHQDGSTKNVKLFPTPAQIANSDLTGLKTTGARKKTLIAFSKAIASGELSLEPTQEVDVFKKKITEISGIGPWTASYMALKVLKDTDAFPETDLILARALKFHPKALVDRMSPWRSYVAILLWKEYAESLKKSKSRKTTKPRAEQKLKRSKP